MRRNRILIEWYSEEDDIVEVKSWITDVLGHDDQDFTYITYSEANPPKEE